MARMSRSGRALEPVDDDRSTRTATAPKARPPPTPETWSRERDRGQRRDRNAAGVRLGTDRGRAGARGVRVRRRWGRPRGVVCDRVPRGGHARGRGRVRRHSRARVLRAGGERVVLRSGGRRARAGAASVLSWSLPGRRDPCPAPPRGEPRLASFRDSRGAETVRFVAPAGCRWAESVVPEWLLCGLGVTGGVFGRA